MDNMGCIIGIEVVIEELRFVESKWLKVFGIGFGELGMAKLVQLAADSFELLATIVVVQLAIQLERPVFDIAGFVELIEPTKLGTAGAVLNTEHIIKHKHSMDTVEHTTAHRVATSEHLIIDTRHIGRHITTIGRIAEHTIATSSKHKPATIMAEKLAKQQRVFVAVAISYRTIADTITAVAFAFGIAIDSTIAIAERMEIGID